MNGGRCVPFCFILPVDFCSGSDPLISVQFCRLDHGSCRFRIRIGSERVLQVKFMLMNVNLYICKNLKSVFPYTTIIDAAVVGRLAVISNLEAVAPETSTRTQAKR